MKTILVKGPALSRSGYGEQTRFALRALRQAQDRFNILLINISWGHTGWYNEDNEERAWIDHLIAKTQGHINNNAPIDISLQITIPNEWEKIAPINIGYTAGIETTRIAPQWIEKAHIMDKIIVVSNHSKNVYNDTVYDAVNQETGETFKFQNQTPIEVVNYAVRSMEQDPIDIDLEYDFNFLSVAQFGPRKNLANTVQWFIQELHGDLTLEQMNYLYAHPKIKSYLTLTHGEGFGIPIFESAYHGNPVIAPQWSGQCDFLHAPVTSTKRKKTKIRPLFCRVEYTIGEIPEEVIWDQVLERGTQWCYPTEKSAKQCMRDMYANYTRYFGMAKKLKKHIIENFTETEQYNKFADAVYGEEQVELEGWLASLSDDIQVHE
jgi:glycosyltransferase involved in cell wall biosynthesis